MLFMIRAFSTVLAVLALFTAAAQAHPHVWVTMKSEVVYRPDGAATGVRNSWTFDDMFSTMATSGLPQKEKGKFTREELASLAEVNITSMKDFDYFTLARVNGKKVPFGAPTDYWLEYNEGLLTLHFTLPFQSPVKTQSVDLETADPNWYVDFSFAEKEPVRLAGAPAECKIAVLRPGEGAQPQGQMRLSDVLGATGAGSPAAQFSNRISVRCP